MRPTRRGIGAGIVIAAALALWYQAGPRSLNAIIVPLVVVGVTGFVSVALCDRPAISRRAVGPGYVGETERVAIDVETDRATTATVVDAVGPGLASSSNRVDRVLDGKTTLEYELQLLARGERSVGPATVTVTDLFGLFRREFRDEATEPVLVYPPVYELTADARRALSAYANTAPEFDRAAFEQLREYERGDSLRDVHWKSVAKRSDDELVVKEFIADDGLDRVSLVGTCPSGDPDRLAGAVATLVDHLFDLDVGIVLSLPGDREVNANPGQRETVFRTLARFGSGTVSRERRTDADIVVEATEDGVFVDFDTRTVRFSTLCMYDTGGSDRHGHAASNSRARPAESEGRDSTDRSAPADQSRSEDSTGVKA